MSIPRLSKKSLDELQEKVVRYCKILYYDKGIVFCDVRQLEWEAEDILSDLLEDWSTLCAKYDPKRGKFVAFILNEVKKMVRRRQYKHKRELKSGRIYGEQNLNRASVSKFDEDGPEPCEYYCDQYEQEDEKNSANSSQFDQKMLLLKIEFDSVLNRLPECYREAFLVSLTSNHGAKDGYYNEIAQRYGKKVETVRSWASRAHNKLVARLKLVPEMQKRLGRKPTKKEITMALRGILMWGTR